MSNPNRCPTCDSPQPSMHPSAGSGGEVTRLCDDGFHDDDLTRRAKRRRAVDAIADSVNASLREDQ